MKQLEDRENQYSHCIHHAKKKEDILSEHVKCEKKKSRKKIDKMIK